MKIQERRVPRMSRIVSEWFREVSEHPGMILEVFGMVSNIYGRFRRTGRLLKVPEGSDIIQAI